MPTPTHPNRTIQTLMHLGLGENEAELYTLMLKYPRSTVQELQQKSPFPRTMLYYILNHLTQLGLVAAHKEHWRTTYVAEDPERLYDLLSDQERAFTENSHSAREIIPNLKQSYRLAGKRPGVRLFDGLTAYEQALEDIFISKPEIILSYRQAVIDKKPGIEIREAYDHKRINKKIIQRTLLFDGEITRQGVTARPYDDYTQFRFIDKKIAAFNADVDIYQGKLLYTTYGEREPSVLLLEDQTFSAMQASLFNMLWDNAPDMTLLSLNKSIKIKPL